MLVGLVHDSALQWNLPRRRERGPHQHVRVAQGRAIRLRPALNAFRGRAGHLITSPCEQAHKQKDRAGTQRSLIPSRGSVLARCASPPATP